MKALFLCSANPSHDKGTAVNIVMAALLEAARENHRVYWICAQPAGPRDHELENAWTEMGIERVGDWTSETRTLPTARPWSTLMALRHAFFPKEGDDYPRFRNPREIAKRIDILNVDRIVFFWDTIFEQVLPYLKNRSTIYYAARPTYAAPLARINTETAGTLRQKLRRYLGRRILAHRRDRHLRLAATASKIANICAVDAKMYCETGISCDYMPNTWPDNFGDDWREKRQREESSRPYIGILGNISGVENTGNVFGMRYLAERILPLLEDEIGDQNWRIRITGGGVLADDLTAAFTHPRIDITGFVDDLDEEILANSIFLLLNNAGPYSGGYTRVIYAMSSGACLIAHRRLAESMLEVVHGHNALLGECAEEIAALVGKA
ncbi:MAG TPA: glycosyltransferase, partial [Rhodospirillales bacterium]|nr:glycosyltransferase [Rhodospirillales bacterium]